MAGAAARLLRPALAILYRQGKDVARLLAQLGISQAAVWSPDVRIPSRVLLEAWLRAAELSGDPDFGLRTSEVVDIQSLSPIGYEYLPSQLFAASATLGEGLARLARYTPLSLPTARVEFAREGHGAVRFRHLMLDVPQVPRTFTEFWIGWIVRAVRDLAVRPVALHEVRFSHPQPTSTALHEVVFAAPVRFSTGEDGFLLAESDLSVPLRTATALTELERRAEEMLARLPPAETLADRVRTVLAAELAGGNASAGEVARALHVSTRTLARKLEEAGTSYQVVLDEVRAGLARQYLIDEERSVQEVSELLGFADARTLHRAFRRWYGQSPTEYRRAQSG